ncbi:MAG: hypothetical protein ACJ8G7_05715 [Rhizobacter sp.]
MLSSPRIATINNQKAVLKVGTDEFFVTSITTNTTTGVGGTTNSPTIGVQPFFSGIALDVTPLIDVSDAIILHLHPSVSVVAESDGLAPPPMPGALLPITPVGASTVPGDSCPPDRRPLAARKTDQFTPLA